MEILTIEELVKLTPEQFAEKWKTGEIHASAYEMLGVPWHEEDKDGNIISSSEN